MEKTITAEFINAMLDFSRRDFPQKIIDECKISLLDYIACASLGAVMLRRENEKFLEAIGEIRGGSSVINVSRKMPSGYAAMINGINAHYIELDDGHRYAMLHPGVPVISAVLAVAQEREIDADRLIRGIITGYEAAIRLACAIQPGHKLRGYHATGTCGVIGAAIGAAVALNYPAKLWNTVLSAAATSASGLLQVIDDKSELKPYNAGRAAASAVEAAIYGVTGLSGPSDVLGGKRGFFSVLADTVNDKYLINGVEKGYAIEGIYRKPYAACRHSHAAIEAVLNLCKENSIETEHIRQIIVSTYDLAVKGHDHTEIEGMGSAKMSIPYGVAAAVKYGQVNFQQYSEECLNDKQIQGLMKRISVREDPGLSKLVPEKRAAVVTVITDSREYTRRVDYPLGEPEHPMERGSVEEKYYSMMTAATKTKEESERILDDVFHLETKWNDLSQVI